MSRRPLLATAALLAACTAGRVERAPGRPVPSPPPAIGLVAPQAEPRPGAELREVVVAATGDVLAHPRVLRSAEAHGGFDHVFAGLGRAVERAGRLGGPGSPPLVTLANLETPLTDRFVPTVNRRPPVLGTRPEVAAALRGAGVDVVSVANNHALDQTGPGLLDTLAAARGAGLAPVGAGVGQDDAYRPWVVEAGGLRVAFVGFTRFVNLGSAPGVTVARLGDERRVRASLEAARGQADLVVAAVHWSSDWERRPAPSERRLARRLVDWGADLVVGTGPHVIQGVERLASPRGEAVVAYSVGNLVSNQGLRHVVGRRPAPGDHPVAFTAGARDAVLLLVSLGSQGPGRVRVGRVAAVPMWTENNYLDQGRAADDVRVVLLDEAPADLRAERTAAIASALGPAAELLTDE